MIVDIDQETIDTSLILMEKYPNQRGYLCPVASKLQRLTGLRWGVASNAAWQGNGAPFVRLPHEESERIHKLDDHGIMEPHSFEFPWEPPAESEA